MRKLNLRGTNDSNSNFQSRATSRANINSANVNSCIVKVDRNNDITNRPSSSRYCKPFGRDCSQVTNVTATKYVKIEEIHQYFPLWHPEHRTNGFKVSKQFFSYCNSQ